MGGDGDAGEGRRGCQTEGGRGGPEEDGGGRAVGGPEAKWWNGGTAECQIKEIERLEAESLEVKTWQDTELWQEDEILWPEVDTT